MSYLALYRKYRPSSFDDFVGQSEVANIIKNEILNNKISHAYLFSGPRGTGKTSTAKIIARMINCDNLSANGVPCGKCNSCLNFNSNSDIIEIDAASNNGVDEIRELRDKVNLVPSFGKYKIYIIDEVHMLTTQAFNALLKTLEEPPAHVIFILATTEFYKIPVTVVSRCQKFQFLKFNIDEIVQKLKQISKSENINISDDVLYEIARLSDGGLRDAINMLDQLSAFKIGELTIQDVYKLNGVVSYEEFKNLLNFIFVNDVVSIVNFIENIDKTGKNYDRFIEDLISFLKDILVFENTKVLSSSIGEKIDCINFLVKIYSEDLIYKLIFMLNDLAVRLKNSSFAKILLITEFIKFSNNYFRKADQNLNNNLISNINFNKNKQIVTDINSLKQNDLSISLNQELTQKKITLSDKLKKLRINNSFATASKLYKEKFVNNWNLVLDKVSNDSNYVSIAGLLNDVQILVVGEKNVIFLALYDSLLERLIENVCVIEDLLFEVFNVHYKVVFLLKDEWEFEKSQYVNNLKSSKKYVYVDENDNFTSNSDSDKDIEKLVSIFGADVVTYK